MQYDPFQNRAIDYINQGHSVIVSAPTGSGKTVIAEHVINQCLTNGQRVIYTAPIKALSNQKYRDFQKNFPDQVGILTGDVTINPNAPTLIMTTEIFRNKILEKESDLNEYSWIIFDEIHYLDDHERGTVWEESLIFLPDHMRILGLSATIPNLDELAGWLSEIHHHPIKTIIETTRPVPLHIFFQCQGEIFDQIGKVKKVGYRDPGSDHHHSGRLPKYVHVKPNHPSSLIKHLHEDNLLPCIYFSFSRRRCEYLAEEIAYFDFLNDEEKKEIKALFNDLVQRYDIARESSTYKILPLVEKGIAYHHAGMLPTLKEVIERLFTTRLIKVIFTTETFALGINMPARTVILDELRKYYGTHFGTLKTRDFYQMAGRAGRRSIDTEGFVFCRVNPHYISSREIHECILGEPEKVSSRFNASYATLLNLYETYKDQLYDIYPRSFHHFQEKKHTRKKAVDDLHNKVHLLKHLGYIRKNEIAEKGRFAMKVYGYEMILSALHENGVLEKLDETELGILSVAVVFEPRKGMEAPALSGKTKELSNVTAETIHRIHRWEKKFRVRPLSKRCYFHLTGCLTDWLRGKSFETALESTDADEGEVVRYFRMAIQLLREIIDTPVSEELRAKIRKTIGTINRDVIDAEKQLRI